MPRRSSTARFVAKLALIVILAVAATYLLLLTDLQRVVKCRLDRIHRAGVPRTWAEAAPPDVPDNKNAVALCLRAYDSLNWGPRDQMAVREFMSNRPQTGGRQAYRAQVRRLLARNSSALALIKQASTAPQCRFAAKWPRTPYIAVDDGGFRGHLAMRGSARLLAADAMLAAEQGDMQYAVESCRAGVRLSARVTSDPAIISFLVGIAMESISLRGLQEVLQRGELTADQCRALFDELGRLDLDRTFRRAVAAEGARALWLFDAMNRGRARRDVFRDLAVTSDYREQVAGAWDAYAGLYMSPVGKLVRLKDEITYLDLLEQTLALTAKPDHQGAVECEAASRKAERLPPYYLLSRWNAYLFRMAMARYRAIALRNAMQVAMALEAYHARFGAYPDALGRLRAYPLGAWAAAEAAESREQAPHSRGGCATWLPLDPFSGKDFSYRRQAQGFLLWSWGEDFKDDNGVPFAHYGLPGDWVWVFER